MIRRKVFKQVFKSLITRFLIGESTRVKQTHTYAHVRISSPHRHVYTTYTPTKKSQFSCCHSKTLGCLDQALRGIAGKSTWGRASTPQVGLYCIGENFVEFGNLLRIHQSCTCQLLIVTELAIEAGLKFAKVYFTNCNLARDFVCPHHHPPEAYSTMWRETLAGGKFGESLADHPLGRHQQQFDTCQSSYFQVSIML